MRRQRLPLQQRQQPQHRGRLARAGATGDQPEALARSQHAGDLLPVGGLVRSTAPPTRGMDGCGPMPRNQAALYRGFPSGRPVRCRVSSAVVSGIGRCTGICLCAGCQGRRKQHIQRLLQAGRLRIIDGICPIRCSRCPLCIHGTRHCRIIPSEPLQNALLHILLTTPQTVQIQPAVCQHQRREPSGARILRLRGTRHQLRPCPQRCLPPERIEAVQRVRHRQARYPRRIGRHGLQVEASMPLAQLRTAERRPQQHQGQRTGCFRVQYRSLRAVRPLLRHRPIRPIDAIYPS